MSSRRLDAEERARIFKALADPRRVELVDTLAKEGPQCGTELAERLGISIALLCHHWDVLGEAGLVAKTRVGQVRYCTLDTDRLREATGCWDESCEAGAVLSELTGKKKAKPARSKPKRKAG